MTLLSSLSTFGLHVEAEVDADVDVDRLLLSGECP